MKYISSQDNVAGRLRKGTILVVEDNDDHWSIIQQAMKQSLPGIETKRMPGASETMVYLHHLLDESARLPELILMDLYLPEREDGWELLEAIKLHHTFRRLPVVVLSHSDDPEDVEQSYYLRSTSYLVKPLSYSGWVTYFKDFRRYWWESVTLPQSVSY